VINQNKYRENMKNLQKGFAHVEILLISVAVIGVVGVGYYVFRQSQNKSAQNSVTQDTSDQATTLPESLSNLKSVDEIRSASSTSLNGATITGIELESENGTLVYKVKLSDGRVLTFNASTGASVSEKTETKDEDDDSLPTTSVTISIDQARKIAQDRRPGKTINKIEVDNDGGKVYYSVRFTDSGKVEVDGTTGAIRKVEEPETQNEENKEEDEQDKPGED